MAKLTIGRYYLLTGGSKGLHYFAQYCPVCKNKIYLTPQEAQEFINNAALYLQRQSLFDIIRGRVKMKLPRIKVEIEWGRGMENEEKSFPLLTDAFEYDNIKAYKQPVENL